ncbi:patatin family protein [Desulfococcaceae bacterium HSG9]|nr:patatin family protein [Desulfococcaceae bacterium HSG9]
MLNTDFTGLILEGGGMRGVYTSGVLRFFMDRRLYLPYVIGVSMGACNGANYVARQPERNRIVNIRFVNDRRFISYRRLLIKGELFCTKFIFDEIPNRLVPFDFKTFRQSRQRCIITAIDCHTGKAVYYDKDEIGDDVLKILQAGCALPLVQKPVHYKGRVLMDGGIADSVPLHKSIADGNRRHIIILTQPEGYRKKRSRAAGLLRRRYPEYKGLCNAFAVRHEKYNATIARIEQLQKKGEIFAIRPLRPLGIKRAERNQAKLYAAYDRGYADAENCYDDLCPYLS